MQENVRFVSTTNYPFFVGFPVGEGRTAVFFFFYLFLLFISLKCVNYGRNSVKIRGQRVHRHHQLLCQLLLTIKNLIPTNQGEENNSKVRIRIYILYVDMHFAFVILIIRNCNQCHEKGSLGTLVRGMHVTQKSRVRVVEPVTENMLDRLQFTLQGAALSRILCMRDVSYIRLLLQ